MPYCSKGLFDRLRDYYINRSKAESWHPYRSKSECISCYQKDDDISKLQNKIASLNDEISKLKKRLQGAVEKPAELYGNPVSSIAPNNGDLLLCEVQPNSSKKYPGTKIGLINRNDPLCPYCKHTGSDVICYKVIPGISRHITYTRECRSCSNYWDDVIDE